MTKSFMGIDFGGSTLKAVCVDQHGMILRSHVMPAGGGISRVGLANAAREAIKRVSGGNTFHHIGLAFGGAIQPDGTMLVNSTNLPNLANLPLVTFFEAELQRKVRVENDARAAMRGEAWSGAAREFRNAMTLTFGTGIGSGIMVDHKILPGAHGKAGEIGVWKMAGDEVTFEDSCAPGRVERATGRRFSDMYRDGDVQPMLAMTGRAIANAHLMLDLEVVVLLGGITELGEPLRFAIEQSFKASCLEDYHSGLAIRIGEHGALAGAVGAASLWRGDAS
jgi:predicted NBD/HSP70 family sugar kinase